MSHRTVLAVAFIASALLAGCSNGSIGTTTIADGGIVVRGDEVVLHGTGGTAANLDAAGNLVIGGHAVAVDAAQRQQLQQYYQAARAVREHGIATGKAGAAIGMRALKNALTHITGGDSAQADASLDAATRRVDEEASKICLDLRQVKAAQDHLAGGLAAFKPFAGIIDDTGHCSTRSFTWRDSGRSLTLKSGDGDGVQVARTEPASVWGLQQGDVIEAVGGQAVSDVDELRERLYASRPADVKIRVRRGHAEQQLTLAASDYAGIANPPPPATPGK